MNKSSFERYTWMFLLVASFGLTHLCLGSPVQQAVKVLLERCGKNNYVPPQLTLENHSFRNQIFVRANIAIVFKVEIDGILRIVRFRHDSESGDALEVASLLSASGYGAELIGVFAYPAKTVAEAMGLPTAVQPVAPRLQPLGVADARDNVEVFEFVEGVEVNARLAHSDVVRNWPNINWQSVKKELNDFMEFCNFVGILIVDLAFIVKSDSKVKIIDVGNYELYLDRPEIILEMNRNAIADVMVRLGI